MSGLCPLEGLARVRLRAPPLQFLYCLFQLRAGSGVNGSTGQKALYGVLRCSRLSHEWAHSEGCRYEDKLWVGWPGFGPSSRVITNWSSVFENAYVLSLLCLAFHFLANQVEWDDRLERAPT